MPIFLDIEVLQQDPDPWMVPDVDTLSPPKTYKLPDTIAKWRAERAAELVPELRERSSLEPLLGGTVLCVGVAVGDAAVRVLTAPTGDEAGEAVVLRRLEEGLARYPGEPLVAWNGSTYDYPFLAKRALRHGLYSLARRVYIEKPWGTRMHLDPFRAWQCGDARSLGKLRQVAQYLGISVADAVDGGQVSALYAAGQLAQIEAHCRSDVEVLRQVYYRLRAAGWLLGEDEVPDDLPVRPPRMLPDDAGGPPLLDGPRIITQREIQAEVRRQLLVDAQQLAIDTTKNAIREAAQAAGIRWAEGVDKGEAAAMVGEATVEQLRTFVRQLEQRRKTLGGG